MKVIGIIAEYNPFHNGHAYQIQKAKELSGADYVVIVMSGNYVQRGTPAILDKFSRAEMALHNGADLVFELPVVWSTASAEHFAAAAVALLDSLGIVDYISFGCECDNLALLEDIAHILADEPAEFSTTLKMLLKQGLSYAAARESALLKYIKEDASSDTVANILSSPNNILAVEYLKALYTRKSTMVPLPILRQGAGYHDTDMNMSFGSASGLRHALLQTNEVSMEIASMLKTHMPATAAETLLNNMHSLVWENDYSSLLYYKLLSEQNTGYDIYGDCNAFLSNRIFNSLSDFCNYSDFCNLLKTKDMALTRIRRVLLHTILNIYQTDYTSGKELGYIPYLRLLGLRKESSFLLKEIQIKSVLPVINRPKKADTVLEGAALAMFNQDVFASNLYYGILSQKRHSPEKNEYQREVIRI